MEKVLGWGCAYVRPVERLMPAKKAETVDGVSMKSIRYWQASACTQYGIECIVCQTAELFIISVDAWSGCKSNLPP